MKQIALFFDVVVILLLNVMEVLRMGAGARLEIACMVFQSVCVLFP